MSKLTYITRIYMRGKVLKLFITKDDANKTRESLMQMKLDRDGIVNDKFYKRNLQRSILITSQESYKLSIKSGIELEAGTLGENILIDINPYSLVAGDRLTIGNLTLEITQNCTLCKGLSSINSNLPKLLKNDRGIFAKLVSESGTITQGDRVEILTH